MRRGRKEEEEEEEYEDPRGDAMRIRCEARSAEMPRWPRPASSGERGRTRGLARVFLIAFLWQVEKVAVFDQLDRHPALDAQRHDGRNNARGSPRAPLPNPVPKPMPRVRHPKPRAQTYAKTLRAGCPYCCPPKRCPPLALFRGPPKPPRLLPARMLD